MFDKLSENVKSFTWIVKMINVVNEFHVSTYATTFSLQVMGIEKSGVSLMTRALHKSNHNINRMIDDEGCAE